MTSSSRSRTCGGGRQLEARELDIQIKEMHTHMRGTELEQEEELREREEALKKREELQPRE
jgi:hypothetical protein